MIVNSIDELPSKILYLTLAQFNNNLSHSFLEHVTKLGHNGGVKRGSYYIIKTGNILRYPKMDKQMYKFSKLMDRCFMNGYQMVMINF